MKNDNFYKPYMYTPSIDYNQNELDDMYPDVYRRVYPHVKNVADEMLYRNNGSFNLTDNMFNDMCNEVMNRSGIYMDGYDDFAVEAAALPGEIRHNDPPPFRDRDRDRDRRFPFPGRRDSFLRDLIRILLLRELFGRRRRF